VAHPLENTGVIYPLPQNVLNIEQRLRRNPFAWRGQFSPQLVEALVSAYAPSDGTVLDPFVGSGTTLCAAARNGNPAIGVEINPAAAYLAQVYRFINCPPEQRVSKTREAGNTLGQVVLKSRGLFSHSSQVGSHDLESVFRHLITEAADGYQEILFSALAVTLDPAVFPSFEEVISARWAQLCETVKALPYSQSSVRVEMADARQLPLSPSSIDFVVTSPPYINVFNYHQNHRRGAEALGWSLLEVARSEIGSNRKHRQNRFLTVVQYCLDIAAVLCQLRLVCKPDARLIFVLGKESNVRKTPFFNGQIFTSLAQRCAGFRICLTQQRVFTNRFGRQIFEDVLHFQNVAGGGGEDPRAIALEILLDARKRAPKDVLADLDSAVQLIHKVAPSPLFDRNTAYTPFAIPE